MDIIKKARFTRLKNRYLSAIKSLELVLLEDIKNPMFFRNNKWLYSSIKYHIKESKYKI